MSLKHQSFAEMSKVDVLQQVKKTLDHIENVRSRRKAKYIKQYQDSLNNSWWRKLLRLKPLTEEETVKKIEHLLKNGSTLQSVNITCSDYIPGYAYDSKKTCEKILRLCESTPGASVFITASDWDLILWV